MAIAAVSILQCPSMWDGKLETGWFCVGVFVYLVVYVYAKQVAQQFEQDILPQQCIKQFISFIYLFTIMQLYVNCKISCTKLTTNQKKYMQPKWYC